LHLLKFRPLVQWCLHQWPDHRPLQARRPSDLTVTFHVRQAVRQTPGTLKRELCGNFMRSLCNPTAFPMAAL